MAYTVYVIKSQMDGRLYKGVSLDPDKRLKQHNAGKTFSTKPYRPWKLIYKEEFENKFEALEREKYYKTGKGRKDLKDLLGPVA